MKDFLQFIVLYGGLLMMDGVPAVSSVSVTQKPSTNSICQILTLYMTFLFIFTWLFSWTLTFKKIERLSVEEKPRLEGKKGFVSQCQGRLVGPSVLLDKIQIGDARNRHST